MARQPVLAVAIEGGLVQSIISDQPELFKDMQLLVIDYDIGGATDNDLVKVPQEDGDKVDAMVSMPSSVEKARIDLNEVLKQVAGDPVPSVESLQTEFGVWGEHPDFPRSDWQTEAGTGDTQLGYWDWVVHKIKMTAEV